MNTLQTELVEVVECKEMCKGVSKWYRVTTQTPEARIKHYYTSAVIYGMVLEELKRGSFLARVYLEMRK